MSRYELAWIGVFLGCGILWAASNILPRDIWLTVVGIAAGVVLGGFLNWLFSLRTSREVRLILRAFAEKAETGDVEFRRNEKGEIVGFNLKRSVSDEVGVSDSVDVKLRQEDTPSE